MVESKLQAISLFSGCGGLDIGARQAGAEVVFACDIDKDSVATLKAHSERTEVIEGDIANINKFPAANLVIGGYPCQSFSLGGKRNPSSDPRTFLYLHFARCLDLVQPEYFVAENVSGLRGVGNGTFLADQIEAFKKAGQYGYRVTVQLMDAKEYGVPQTRKRLFLVGVRNDLEQVYLFPSPTHGKPTKANPDLKPYASHGNAIRDLPIWPNGEFYERPGDPDGHFSWYYMSRNRKARWGGPSYTVLSNWRHTPLHPASPVMTLTWSNLADGWKQRWDFCDEYEHIADDTSLPILETPRRLSWREISRIQTFPEGFEPCGSVASKFNQLGNSVPPLLAKSVIENLVSGNGLSPVELQSEQCSQLTFWE